MSTDVAMVQALNLIGAQIRRLADVEEEKLANERIAMGIVREGSKLDGGGDLKDEHRGPHVILYPNFTAEACMCSIGEDHPESHGKRVVAHLHTDHNGQAHACFCPSTVNH